MQRRTFLQQTALAATGLLLANHASAGKVSKPFGIQLYSLKEDMAANPWQTLDAVAKMGYTQIESFEGANGMFWGKTNKEFAQYLQERNMQLISSHCDIHKDFETKAAMAGEIGVKYLICPWKGPQTSIDAFKRFAEEFNRCGEICKKNGLRFAYHNHDYSFVPLDGVMGQDVMMVNTDAALVDFEMDMYWVVTAGLDPIEYMTRYKDRFPLAHIKNRTPKATSNFDSCNLKTGSIDYAKVLLAAKKLGLKYAIVEQEKYEGTTPLTSAADNAEFMKTAWR
jgi:sugar phosphate isomerase/epimerase